MRQEPPRGDTGDDPGLDGPGPDGPGPDHPGPDHPGEVRGGLWQTWPSRRLLVFGILLFVADLMVQVEVYRLSDHIFLPTLVGGLIAVVLPCYLASRLGGSRFATDWQLTIPSPAVLFWAAVLALTGLYPTAELAGLSARIHPVDPEWIALFNTHLPRTPGDTVIAVVAVVLVAPLAEEIIFRGLLYRLARRQWGPWVATAVSTLSFALVHAEPWILFGLIGLGLLLAFVYEVTRSVAACTVVHAVHNAISLWLILSTPAGIEAELPAALQQSWALLASCALLLFAAQRLRRSVEP
jgi:membrane protease YdiL (CAAX protease family)